MNSPNPSAPRFPQVDHAQLAILPLWSSPVARSSHNPLQILSGPAFHKGLNRAAPVFSD